MDATIRNPRTAGFHKGKPTLAVALPRVAARLIRLGLVLTLPAVLPAQVSITEFPAPTSGRVTGIVSGPDGALWFCEYDANKIGRISTAGVITEFPIPTPASEPHGITVGSDGAIWFGEYGGNKIGRITTAGAITEFPLATPSPEFMTLGPDGAVWFAESPGKIGRITAAGVITEFAIPTASPFPWYIVNGPDGALWFTEMEGNKIGRITTAGAITEFAVPTANSNPFGITSGPDGALWFTESIGNKIGRITTAGVITEFTVPTVNASPFGIAAGPDGALWFAEHGGAALGRITTGGVITEYPTSGSAGPYIPVTGPDNALWFTEEIANKIGRAALSSSATCTFTLSSNAATVGASASTGSVTITTQAGCSYAASAPSGSFASITTGANYTGSQTVSYSITANSGATRGATLTIAGQSFTINQLNGCVFGLTPSSNSFAAGGGTGSITVGLSSSTCTFSVTSNNPFLNVTGTSSSSVSYSVASNSSTAGRNATITVSGTGSASGQSQTFTVIQAGNVSCTGNFSLGQANQTFTAAGGTGTVTVAAPAGCPWSVSIGAATFVSITSGGSGTGNGTVSYSAAANTATSQRTGSLTIAGLPYAVTQSGSAPLNCTASVPAPAQIAIEGRTEVLGDLILTCTGLTAALTADVSLTLNTNVTNRLTGTTTDAALLVNGASTASGGTISGYSTLNWFGVSIAPAGGGTGTVRITNVRADASLLGTPASLQSIPVTGSVAVSAAVSVPVTNPLQTLAYAGPTLVFQKGTSSTQGTNTTIPLQYQEATMTAFHIASGSTPATRLHLVLSGIPANVQIFAPIFPTEGTTRAQLFSAQNDGSGGAGYTGTQGSMQQLTVSGGVAFATWVVLAADSTQFEMDTFPLLIQNPNSVSLTQIQVAASLAPVSTVSVASTSAPVPRYRDFSVPQFLVNLRAINTAQGPPTGSALSSEARLAPRLTSAAAGSNGTFTNQVTNDNQDTAATDVIVGSKVSGGTITNCQTTLGTCSVSGDNATVTIAVLPAMQSVTITIFVTGFSCTATICPVQDDLTTLSDQPNADLSASKASSVFLVNGTVAGFPANLTILSGTPQSAPVGTAFANPLQVTVTDALNTLLGNQTVIFTVPTSGASATLSTNTPLTNSSGVASVTAQANGIQGAYTVTAAIPSAS